MSKTYKERPDKWRKNLHKKNKHNGNNKPWKQNHQPNDDNNERQPYSPFSDPQEYHESF